MDGSTREIDEKYILRTFDLARRSQEYGDYPFGAIIIRGDETIAEALNNRNRITGHPEVEAIETATNKLGKDLTGCTLYSNFEPCAMCSFLVRDRNISRIVFSVPSPYWGGYTRWDILKTDISDPLFTTAGRTGVPNVTGGVLKEMGEKIFASLDWKMHLTLL